MSTPVERCRPADAEPVSIPADALESTAPDYLRGVKRDLEREGRVPAELTVEARFDDDCSFATQDEADRVREHVRAAALLGAGRVTVRVSAVASERKVRPALEACAERARREGVTLEVDGPVSV